MSEAAWQVEHLSVAYGEQPALWDASLSLPSGVMAAVVGQNGAGKSTLLKGALGLAPRIGGRSLFFGQELKKVRQRVAYMPQRLAVDWDFPASVVEVVEMGLYGRLGWFRRPGKKERQAAMQALESVAMEDFAARQISELSGGQQQRAFLARALVQRPDLLLCDEPFAGVDKGSEAAIFSVLRDLRDQGAAVAVVHHDLETAKRAFDWVIFVNKTVISAGPISSHWTDEQLATAFGGPQ